MDSPMPRGQPPHDAGEHGDVGAGDHQQVDRAGFQERVLRRVGEPFLIAQQRGQRERRVARADAAAKLR